jgi:hypothetical protein
MNEKVIIALIDALKEPALILAVIVIAMLGYLVIYLIKTKDSAILNVVAKVDPAIESMNRVATVIDTVMKIGGGR